jgi:hypothetical protein
MLAISFPWRDLDQPDLSSLRIKGLVRRSGIEKVISWRIEVIELWASSIAV